MSLKEENSIFKLIPRLGRRSSQANTQTEKSTDDELNSPESIPSGKSSSKGPAPVAPPRTRRTGWADELKSAKQKRIPVSANQEHHFENNKISNNEDIPVIPDIDEIIDDTALLDISNIPSDRYKRAEEAYKELDIDLEKNKKFSVINGVDLSLLTQNFYPEHLVQEPLEKWTWDTLFAQVASEINSENQKKTEEEEEDEEQNEEQEKIDDESLRNIFK